MREFYATGFYVTQDQLVEYLQALELEIMKRGGDYVADSLEVCGSLSLLDDVKAGIEHLSLRRALEEIESLKIKFSNQHNVTLEKLRDNFSDLQKAIRKDLRERTFIIIPFELIEYYDQPNLLDKGTNDNLTNTNFPNAAKEYKEAGNCYATGNNTACVFHLMRALEYGLRALAGSLNVPFPQTFELKTWDELIGDIEKEIKKIIQQPKTPQRAKDLEFYNGASTQFRYFKDGWRNHVMHTRTDYDQNQAMSVMVHVREFMQHLARNGLKE